MNNEVPFALPVLTTALNVAGIFAAVHLWLCFRHGLKPRIVWLLPAFLLSAAAEAALSTRLIWLAQNHEMMTAAVFRRAGIDLLMWPVVGLCFYRLRGFLMKRPPAVTKLPTAAGPSQSEATAQSLEEATRGFITAADQGDIAVIAGTYTEDFACIRVADEGGFAHLSSEQMLAYWGRSSQSGGVKHALPTRSTVFHHAEVMRDMGLVMITRIKDFGAGWEPVFYTLVWRHTDRQWRLQRELVHQRSIPRRL